MKETELIANVLNLGIDISYDEISICDISKRLYTPKRNRKKFQLYCDHRLLNYAQEYDDAETCADKFVLLKHELDRIKAHVRNNKSKEKNSGMSKVPIKGNDSV